MDESSIGMGRPGEVSPYQRNDSEVPTPSDSKRKHIVYCACGCGRTKERTDYQIRTQKPFVFDQECRNRIDRRKILHTHCVVCKKELVHDYWAPVNGKRVLKVKWQKDTCGPVCSCKKPLPKRETLIRQLRMQIMVWTKWNPEGNAKKIKEATNKLEYLTIVKRAKKRT